MLSSTRRFTSEGHKRRTRTPQSRIHGDDVLKEMDGGGVTRGHPSAGWIRTPTAGVEARASTESTLDSRQLPARQAGERRRSTAEEPSGLLGLRFALLQPHQQTWLTDGSSTGCGYRCARTCDALLGPVHAGMGYRQRHPAQVITSLRATGRGRSNLRFRRAGARNVALKRPARS